MNTGLLKELLLKYHCAGGRYSISPQMINWKKDLSFNEWQEDLERNYSKEEGVDLYIHIPFCESLCTFCGCNIAITKNHNVQKDYVQTLLSELRNYYNLIPDLKIASIYLGGGTPNYLTAENLDKLLSGIKYYSSSFMGTIEADPRYLSATQLKVLREYKFTRISFGVQDFDENILKNLNRPQTFDQVKRAQENAKEYGIKEIFYDLIYGLPLQDIGTMTHTFNKLEELKPDGVAFYPLAKAPWQEKAQNALSIWQDFSVSQKYDLFLKGHEILEDLNFSNLGFGHYLRKSHGATYKSYVANLLQRNIMGFVPRKAKQLIGLGVSAISYSGSSYIQNEKILAKYVHNIKMKNMSTFSSHRQSQTEHELLDIYQSLTCQSKVDLQKVRQLFDEEKNLQINIYLNYFQSDGLIRLGPDVLEITELGKHFVKNICSAFDPN